MLFEEFSAFFDEDGLTPIKAKKSEITERVRRQAAGVQLSSAYALIAIISIVLIVAFTYLWATMTGAVSNVFAGAMVASAVAFIVSLNKCVHFS